MRNTKGVTISYFLTSAHHLLVMVLRGGSEEEGVKRRGEGRSESNDVRTGSGMLRGNLFGTGRRRDGGRLLVRDRNVARRASHQRVDDHRCPWTLAARESPRCQALGEE
ncbi:hypothetical protein EVAR_100138_1 [Eumeta japonica]|uniref:Uncharacterized protein n=1 Tax=Eumeta variegata TaxID=151549 RepID=A0A4C1SA59_EUMVA|nr:hypothetical protein EVAR_100138_1 [Eumeta japonica]